MAGRTRADRDCVSRAGFAGGRWLPATRPRRPQRAPGARGRPGGAAVVQDAQGRRRGRHSAGSTAQAGRWGVRTVLRSPGADHDAGQPAGRTHRGDRVVRLGRAAQRRPRLRPARGAGRAGAGRPGPGGRRDCAQRGGRAHRPPRPDPVSVDLQALHAAPAGRWRIQLLMRPRAIRISARLLPPLRRPVAGQGLERPLPAPIREPRWISSPHLCHPPRPASGPVRRPGRDPLRTCGFRIARRPPGGTAR